MDSKELLKRISIHPDVCHGKPVIAGTRVTVQSILEYMAAGDTLQDVIDHFDFLKAEDIQACLAYASELARNKTIVFKAA